MTTDPTSNTPSLIAHRGFGRVYPENTAYAAEHAATHDHITMIEVDVVPTADRTVVCFHDADLHGTDRSRGITDARGTVWKTDSETVLDATVLDSDQTVARFETVLDVLPADVGINIELKNYGGTESAFATALTPDERKKDQQLWEPFVTDVLDILDGFSGSILVSSFYEGALAAVRSQAPDLPIGVLVWDSLEDGLSVAEYYDAEAIHPPWNLVAGTPFSGEPYLLDRSPEVSVDVVEAAHEAGRDVNVWTVDSWYRAAQLTRAGVDGLIADYPIYDTW